MPGGARDSRAALGDPPKAPSVRVVSRAAGRAPVFAAGRRQQHAGRVLHPIFAACAWLIFAVCAQADALRADFSPLTLRPRSNAPAIFDLKLHRLACSERSFFNYAPMHKHIPQALLRIIHAKQGTIRPADHAAVSGLAAALGIKWCLVDHDGTALALVECGNILAIQSQRQHFAFSALGVIAEKL